MDNWVVDGTTANLTLLRGTILISSKDLPLISKYHWWILLSNPKYPEVRTKIEGKATQLSRFLLQARPGQLVDHVNGNRLDNRRENIRITDYSGNARNSKIPSNNTSGFKGVTWYPTVSKWAAQIEVMLAGKRKGIRLGYYKTKEEAARVYDRAARKYFGEFARLNFPGESS